MSGFAGSVPSVKLPSVAPGDITSVPSESVVCATRLAPSTSVPAPVFVSGSAVGAEIVAVTPEATSTVGAVSVPVPVNVAFSLNVSDSALASSSTSAIAFAVANSASLPSSNSSPPSQLGPLQGADVPAGPLHVCIE